MIWVSIETPWASRLLAIVLAESLNAVVDKPFWITLCASCWAAELNRRPASVSIVVIRFLSQSGRPEMAVAMSVSAADKLPEKRSDQKPMTKFLQLGLDKDVTIQENHSEINAIYGFYKKSVFLL